MSNKFFYLYLTGGTIALILLVYQVLAYRSNLSLTGVLLNLIPVVLLYYLAIKVYLEKKDKDLM